MTAPDLVEVVAKALFAHDWPDEDLAADCGAYSDDYRDAARAVLAALEGAGTVEWAIEDTEDGQLGPSTDNADDLPDMREIVAEVNRLGVDARIVSWLTLPWTAVEG